MLLKLTGSSCSGKSTAARRAAAGHDGLVVFDFDEIGVPDRADLVWRQRSGEVWLKRVLECQAAGADVLLTGQSPLGEILATPSAPALEGIAVCLLEVADRERFIRLERRDPGRWDREAKRSFVGWARWHRRHADDPLHCPEVLTDGGWDEMQWERWSGWTAADPRWQTSVIDTTGRPVEDTAAEVGRWIERSRSARDRGVLALGPGWADRAAGK